jgi:hypothetical protein
MKNILFSIFILGLTLSCAIENVKLTGVVTYKDSFGSSSKSDAGSEIYAISEADIGSTQYKDITTVIENFRRNKEIYSLSLYNTVDPGKSKKAQDFFDTLSNSANKYISGFKQLPGVVKTSTNGTGNYTLNLKPGKYYVLVISGNVTSNNRAEFKGKIDYKIVDIKSAGETFLDVNFEKNENPLIMFVTGWQLQGC